MAEQSPQPMPTQYKPNIYPIMYWALAYGVIAGAILFIVFLLSQYITVIWFPVFLAGLIWGGWRNYKKQKGQWQASHGVAPQPGSPIQEFKEAASDILDASREMMAEQQPIEADQPPSAAGQSSPPAQPYTPPPTSTAPVPGEETTPAQTSPDQSLPPSSPQPPAP
jgi:hypothetical protein